MEKRKKINILLVEDNRGEAKLTSEIIIAYNINCSVHHCIDGIEALDFLNKTKGYHNETNPDLIILDLNMPRKDGREVLADIKSNKNFRYIPVIVLTMSAAESDIQKTYDLHANCYLTKSMELDAYVSMLHSTLDFWLKTVTLTSNI